MPDQMKIACLPWWRSCFFAEKLVKVASLRTSSAALEEEASGYSSN